MDWDDNIFSRDDFRAHLDNLDPEILVKHDLDKVIERTTENTRTGGEFSFKPTHLEIGTMVGSRFYRGFASSVDRNGADVQTGERLASSFWIRLPVHESVRVSYVSSQDLDSLTCSMH